MKKILNILFPLGFCIGGGLPCWGQFKTQVIVNTVRKVFPLFLLKLCAFLLFILVFWSFAHLAKGQDFNKSNLQGAEIENATSLKFGPDGRLYVSQQDGLIKVFAVRRNGFNNYEAVKTEEITLIRGMTNHDDDGALNTTLGKRQVTGILVKGTAEKPILYVSSSDPRIGGPSKGDTNLDTNSGTVSRLTWIHDQPPLQLDFSNLSNEQLWEKVDLVRGLPRSEENHSPNGMQIATIGNKKYMFLTVGGFTNAGAPSQNFTKITEYALAAAVLSIDLTALEAMPIYTNARTGDKFVYDIPTLDDPDRENIDKNHPEFPYSQNHPLYEATIDLGDPFGGNDGLNQAKVVVSGPVQVYAPGLRNAYDLVITKDRRMYVTDNGANPGWGGFAEKGGTADVTNNYWDSTEPGTDKENPLNGSWVNNEDHLELVTGVGIDKTIDSYVPGSFYGGHPNPIRANPAGAGLYTHFGANSDDNGVFRTVIYDPAGAGDAADPNKALPADWPPVPAELANPVEGDFQNPGVDDKAITVWQKNCNAIAEYTASNLGGKYKGNLLAGSSSQSGELFRLELNEDGTKKSLDQDFAKVEKNFVLGLACQSDNDIFGGTIWAATYGEGVKILEPVDYDGSRIPNCTGADDPSLDEDFDGYNNADEIDVGTDPCNGLDTPNDADQDFTSDLNDPDDDNDGIEDYLDVFQLGSEEEIAGIPFDYELFNDKTGFYGLGLIGIMTNLYPDDNYINWLDIPNIENPEEDDVYGGAAGIITVKMTDGDALGEINTQEKGFQFGVNVDANTLPFTLRSVMLAPFHSFTGNESQGVFIGTGDQDNYIKIVLNEGGIAVVKEDNGNHVTLEQQGLNGTPGGNITVFFSINPMDATVQPMYAIDYDETPGAVNAITKLSKPISFTGELLEVIQQPGKPLAVGIIGTSKGSTQPFKGNWDKFAADFQTTEGEWFTINSSDGSLPTARHENGFVQVGVHFYLLGGRDDKKIEKYNLTTKTWATTKTTLNDVHHFQAVVFDGLIYIINAMKDDFPTETLWPNVLIYDPINDKLFTGPEIPEDRRRGSSGAVVYNNKIYVIAGIQNGHTDGWVKWVDEFDPNSGEWKTLADAPRERDHFMAALNDGKIYVAGGHTSFYNNDTDNYDRTRTIGEVDVYDIENNTWSTLPNNLPTQRVGAAVGILGNELFVMGGESAQTEIHSETEALNLRTHIWRKAKKMLTPRHGIQAIVNNNGIFVAAGAGDREGPPQLDSQEAFFMFGQKDPLGNQIPNSILKASTKNIDFGKVEVGQTVTTTLLLTNSGGDLGIIIGSILLTGAPDITLLNDPANLPVHLSPGDSLSLRIVLKQTSETNKSGTLTIKYSSSNQPLIIPIKVGDDGGGHPKIETLSTSSGNAGATLILTGKNLSGKVEVKFNDTSIPESNVVVKDENTVEVTLPDASILPDGDYEIQVIVNGKESEKQRFIVDNKAPNLTLSDNNPANYSSGEISLAVEATDETSGVDSVQIRTAGFGSNLEEAAWVTVPATGDSTYSVTLKETDFDEFGLHYQFRAVDSVGNADTTEVQTLMRQYPPNAIMASGAWAAASASATLRDYQLIAIPFATQYVTSVLDELEAQSDTTWRLYQYQEDQSKTGYERVGFVEYPKSGFSSFEPGKGYYFIYRHAGAINVSGALPPGIQESGAVSLTLSPGYNLIGNPYLFPIDWQQVMVHNANENISDQLKIFTGGTLSNTTVLAPFQGGFALNTDENNDITLEIPITAKNARYAQTASPEKRNPLNAEAWEVPLRLESGNLYTHLSAIGMQQEASESADRWDDFTLPRFLEYLELNFHHPEFFLSHFTKDIVPTQAAYTWAFEVATNLSTPEVTLSWDNHYFGPNERELMLLDMHNYRVIDMRKATSYTFSVGEAPRPFKIFYGDAATVKANMLPESIMVGEAYPNPMQNQFTIPLSLPDGDHHYDIQVNIYNLTGQLIKSITQKALIPGYHTLHWNRQDKEGNTVSPGLYLYRVNVDNMNVLRDGRVVVR